MKKLEICCGSYYSAQVAQKAGAYRVELCSGLGEGGLTPSLGLVRAVCALDGLVHHVLIRPRGGDFLYTEAEKHIILDDIAACIEAGADGVVVGALDADGHIDVDFLRECVKQADGRAVTFHRAFDLCAEPLRALQEIADAGADRLLTSGQASTAEAGIPMLRRLVKEAPSTLTIMPGCGVNAANAARILSQTGATDIHASARQPLPSQMRFRHQGVSMGKPDADEYATLETSPESVQAILEALSLLA